MDDYDYDYEDEYSDQIDETLSNYTRNERNIFSQEKFNQIRERYPLKEDVEVYRGINFKTRLQYHRFMKKLVKNGGYMQSSAAGFTRCYDTAEDFAETTKTYYPTMEVVMAEEKRNKEKELMTGYCGVILKVIAKSNEVIDVNRSKFGIEDEVLFKPNELIKIKLEDVQILDKYRTIVKKSDFDLNDYIQKCDNLYDPMLTFITVNYSNRVSNDSANHILELCLPTEEKRIKYKEKMKSEKYSKKEIIFEGNYLTVLRDNVYENCRSITDEKMTEMFFLGVPTSIATFEDRGCFRKEQYDKIKKISNSILNDFMEVHFDLGQNEKIDTLAHLSWFAMFANKEIKKTYEDKVLKRKGKDYRDLNKDISKINKSELTKEEKEDKIKEYSDSLVRLIKKINEDMIDPMKKSTKVLSGELLKEKEKRESIKNKAKNKIR